MLLNILAHTPIWVLVLFAALLALGLMQTRSRSVSLTRAMVLPVAMLMLSIYGVLAAFGANPLPIGLWLIAGLISASVTARLGRSDAIFWHRESKRLSVPGSWWPLALMMAIFTIKYVAGAATAINPTITGSTVFIVTSCALYGALSGALCGRAIPLWQASREQPSLVAVPA